MDSATVSALSHEGQVAEVRPMAGVADRLASIEVLDPEGRSEKLGDQWRDKPVVLVFIRHFG